VKEVVMLVLSRKSHEAVVVGGPSAAEHMLKVTVLEIGRGHVKLGFDVCEDVPVHRWEVWQRIRGRNAAGDDNGTATTD
jgi:carbon storage regulator CsrA